MQIVPKSFYQSADVVSTAKALIGKILQTNIEGIITSGRIVETEAYRGADDKGCHSFIHGKTERTAVMFESGGVSYVYICYGIHHMINVVTNSISNADAILIRAIEPIEGEEIMLARRGGKFKNYYLSGGPGKVCQCLGIEKSGNNLPFYDHNSPISIYDDKCFNETIMSTPRVGMSHRVAEYANNHWRFYVKGNPYVSRPLLLKYDY